MVGSSNTPELIDSGPLLEATGVVHRVAEPNAPGPHPTVVMLQGRSGNEEVMWIFRKALPVNWLLVAPRAIETDPRGGYSWYVRMDEELGSLEHFAPAISAVERFTRALPRIYNADPDQLYFMGFSQGAAMSYAMAMTHPTLIKAIAGLVGFTPTGIDAQIEARVLAGMPIFNAVGLKDERIPYAESVRSAETLRAAGADLTYNEYDTGHKLNRQGMQDLQAWWLDRSREQYSRTRI